MHVTRSPILCLEWVTRYYIYACFGPLPNSLVPSHYRPFLIYLYVLSRGIGLSKVIYEVLLSSGVFEYFQGPNDSFRLIEASVWALGMLPYIACDILLLNTDFLRNVDKCFEEMKKIHESTKHVTSVTGGNSAFFKSLRFMIFSGCLDWFQNIFTFLAMQGTMTERPHVYSALPWQTPFLETLFWFLESFNLAVLFNVISMMTTLPGVWAYYLEECLNRMTDAVVEETQRQSGKEGFKDSGVVQQMMEHYRNLYFILREVNKRMGWGAMSFGSSNCIQQTAETFVIFQLLKAGASFEDVQFLLTDIFISGIRMAHSYHALGVVDGACQEFLSAVRIYLTLDAKRGRSHYKRKLDRLTLKSFQDIQMRVGTTKCENDFLLVGMSVYMDNYFSAALWP